MSNIYNKTVTPTVTAGAYLANTSVGGRMVFTDFHRGVVRAVTVGDAASQAVAYVLVLFDALPTNIADQGAYTIADADLDNIRAVLSIAATDRQAFTDNSASRLQNLAIPIASSRADGSIYAYLFTTGTPTYAATNDVSLTIQAEL